MSPSAPNSMETAWTAGVWDCCDVHKDGTRRQITDPCAGSVQQTDHLGYPMATGFRIKTVRPAAVLALVCHCCDGANKKNGQLIQRKSRAIRREVRYAQFWEEQLFVPVMHLSLVPPFNQDVFQDKTSLPGTLPGKGPLRDSDMP